MEDNGYGGERVMFVKQYAELLEIIQNGIPLKHDGDTVFQFGLLSRDQVLHLHKLIGYDGGDEEWYESQQNSSPTIKEFFKMVDDYEPGKILFSGYVVLKPRDDYRVSIEELNGENLTADEALEILNDLGDSADESSNSKINGVYSVRLWWD
jgi:hypothetical protein